MADLSNKALALLLIVAIVTSVGSSMFVLMKFGRQDITGFATTDTGLTNFSINTAVSIRFVSNVIPFGTGRINGTQDNRCLMGTNNSPPNLEAASGCIGFNTTVHLQNLTIENDGNLPANVSLNFTRNASTFIGGSVVTPSFQYEVTQGEAGSCTTIGNGSSFKEVGDIEVNGTNARICTNLAFGDANDLIEIGVWVRIPEDVPTGAHTVTLTAIACDDGSC